MSNLDRVIRGAKEASTTETAISFILEAIMQLAAVENGFLERLKELESKMPKQEKPIIFCDWCEDQQAEHDIILYRKNPDEYRHMFNKMRVCTRCRDDLRSGSELGAEVFLQ